MLLGVAIHQSTALVSVSQAMPGVHLGERSLFADNVGDLDAWFWLFHTPETSADAVNFLRNNHLLDLQRGMEPLARNSATPPLLH